MRVGPGWILVLLVIVGCTSKPEPPLTGDGRAFQDGFDDRTIVTQGNWTLDAPTWKILTSAAAASPQHVLEGRGTNSTPAIVLARTGKYADFDASVQLRSEAAHVRGGGILVHMVGPGDFSVLAVDAGIHHIVLTTFVKGTRTHEYYAAWPDDLSSWHLLSVHVHGTKVEATVDGSHHFSAPEEANRLGVSGLLALGEQPVEFDDFSITPR